MGAGGKQALGLRGVARRTWQCVSREGSSQVMMLSAEPARMRWLPAMMARVADMDGSWQQRRGITAAGENVQQSEL